MSPSRRGLFGLLAGVAAAPLLSRWPDAAPEADLAWTDPATTSARVCQWFRDGVPIAGATGQTLTLTDWAAGGVITARFEAVDWAGAPGVVLPS